MTSLMYNQCTHPKRTKEQAIRTRQGISYIKLSNILNKDKDCKYFKAQGAKTVKVYISCYKECFNTSYEFKHNNIKQAITKAIKKCYKDIKGFNTLQIAVRRHGWLKTGWTASTCTYAEIGIKYTTKLAIDAITKRGDK